jgi:2-methylcitrate dehydratase PrpD
VAPYSQTVARFLSGLKLDDVPPAVVDKAKLVFLDTLGIALASSTMDFGRMVSNVAQKLGGAAASRLIGSPRKLAAANAVLANGTLASLKPSPSTAMWILRAMKP